MLIIDSIQDNGFELKNVEKDIVVRSPIQIQQFQFQTNSR